MRLQRQLSRVVDNKEYSKYVVVIPPKVVKKAGFHAGQEIEADAKNGRIILKKK